MGFNLGERVRKADKKQLLLLLMLFLLAFGVRGHLLKFEYMFGFDTYYHARMVSYLLENGQIAQPDVMSYYFMGGAQPPQNTFFWYFTAGIYKIATLGAGYDKMLWMQFVKVLPALFGALISVAMYFLGKEIYGRKAGYVMAFVAAINPSFVYRTLAGFFEEDSLGFLWLVVGLVFFVRAVKNPVFNKKGIQNAVLAGFFFGVMAITWEMFLLIPLVLSAYLVFALMHIYSKRTRQEFIDFIKLYALGMGIFSVIATLNYGTVWVNRALNYALESLPGGLELLVFGGGIALVAVLVYLGYSMRDDAKRESSAKTINFVAMMLLYIALIFLVVTFATYPEMFKKTDVLGASVGEENTGKQFFGVKYNALIIFPWLAMLLIPIRMYRNKKEHLSAIVFFWIFITFFMAWYKLKFTYTFGLPIAAAAGLVSAELFYYLKGRTGIEQKAVAATLGLILLSGAAAATIFVPDKFPTIEQSNPTWKPALLWMSNPENVPADAKMFNWWNQGHWISFISERAVLVDNRNLSWEADSDFALFVITHDLNEALEIMRRYDSDYIVLSSDMYGGIASYGHYAYNTTDSYDPRIIKYLVPQPISMPCSATVEGGRVSHTCGGNHYPDGSIAGWKDTWTNESTNVVDVGGGVKLPIYIYRSRQNDELYRVNDAVNLSMLARLWFHEPLAMQYFEEVYPAGASYENGEPARGEGIRVFRVKKENF